MTTWMQVGGGLSDPSVQAGEAMQQVIARAWADGTFKAELLVDPDTAFAELGVHWPDHYQVHFYDDPTAKVGDWSSVVNGCRATVRIPIPAPPAGGEVAAGDLVPVGGDAGGSTCCTGLCPCAGAVHDSTWY